MPLHSAFDPDLPADNALWDVLVVGGGLNGCGIARDLAGRGWRVLLAEAGDLGAQSSCATSKLIHGGLLELNQSPLREIRKALREGELLLHSAPHIVWPLRFVLPLEPTSPPAWRLRLDLLLHDHLAPGNALPRHERLALRGHVAKQPLPAALQNAFAYSDVWADDARLVLLNALDARNKGARVLPHTRVQAARPCTDGATPCWAVSLDTAQGPLRQRARVLVNATGAWAHQFSNHVLGHTRAAPRLVRSSHIVVPRIHEHEHAYLWPAGQGQALFALPYEHRYTLIGSTQVEVGAAALEHPTAASAEDVDTLCREASRHLHQCLTPSDVVWHFAALRPMPVELGGSAQNGQLELSRSGPALLQVWGGRLCTYRHLAEKAANLLGPVLGESRLAWTTHAHLPGGDFSAWVNPALASSDPQQAFEQLVRALNQRYPFMDGDSMRRLARRYGSRVPMVLGLAETLSDLGSAVAPGLYERELHYLRDEEWARSADDVLWRRTKLGLRYNAQQRHNVQRWFA
ncbi:glycerol-3-phosphate dehydrogenase [Roseateles sp. BYS180W]|uniref:Glycerol-3-phosphate dehydrogenase n=1 Tax=Roseateles rivi TaxID=3299028 RepID=A0ABW7FQU5_9BURK